MVTASPPTESPKAWLLRQVLGLVYVLRPHRAADAPFLAWATLARLLKPGPRVPDVESLFTRPAGYGGPVEDESVPALMAGMRNGFYLMSHCGPRKWWSPPRRGVMRLADVRIPRRFRRTMRTCGFTVAFDTAFAEVVRACAAPRKSFHLTWLYPSTQKLLCDLHDAGFAHSVEVRDESGELVGGVFGVMAGPVFSALSMFHTRNDASKLALIALYRQLAACGVHTVDHMVLSPWVADLGGVDITRDELLTLLRGPDPECARPGRWSAVATTTDIAEWQPLAAAESGDEEPVRAVAARG